MKIILASQSFIRRQLLENAGINIEAIASDFNEDHIKNAGGLPEEIAKKLAFEKAKIVSKKNPEAYIIGADQILIFKDKIINKSPDIETARKQLQALSGQTHYLLSAISIVKNGEEVFQYTDKATLKMRDLSTIFLEDYLSQIDQNVLKSVGSYQLEGRGIQLFEEIKGDYFTILGLPLLPILHFLRSQKGLLS
ncbi:MAG: Maf family protein [Alphaproteobacteria bacterium]